MGPLCGLVEVTSEKSTFASGGQEGRPLQWRFRALFELVPQGPLEIGIGLEAQLGHEAHHSGGADAGTGGELGHRCEPEQRIIPEQSPRRLAARAGQLAMQIVDSCRDGFPLHHEPHVSALTDFEFVELLLQKLIAQA
ncbi:hypothetical protein D3C87_1636980 [compost metagenome]